MCETYDAKVRGLLVEAARVGRLLTYGEVVRGVGGTWTPESRDAERKALFSALVRIGQENLRNEEPLLPALVVRKDTKLPGSGFFQKFCHKKLKSLHEKLVTCVQKFDWPD